MRPTPERSGLCRSYVNLGGDMNRRDEGERPLAREGGLVVRELDGELLVYDLETHRSHCLNRTAALVWGKCDGRRDVREIARGVGAALKSPVDERVVWFALERLERKNLLRGALAPPADSPRLSRRELMRRIGVAAVLIPVITTITAPTAYANVSCSGTCTATSGCTPPCTCVIPQGMTTGACR
jgi:hypothetical protein